MNDLTQLEAAIGALRAKVTETKATLIGLVQAILGLQTAPDQQAAIDALTQTAQAAFDELNAAEDAADDHAGGGSPPVGPS